MRALFNELRRNPDIIAVVVLSLLLGVAPRAGLENVVWDGRRVEMKIYRGLSAPDRAFDVPGRPFEVFRARMHRRLLTVDF
ncbi:MAG: hypothetical protein ACM3S5_07275 [Rhodospirillales bacterium]